MNLSEREGQPLSLRAGLIRFFGLSVYLAAVAGVIHYSAASREVAGESSLIEQLQLLFLAITCVLFLKIALRFPVYRRAGYLFAAFFICLAIREMDALLDQIVHGFWKYPAWLVALVALALALRQRELSYQSIRWLISCRSFSVLLIGLSLLLVFSRLYGMSELWLAVMGEAFVRDVKNLSEEGIELLAYALIALAAACYWFEISHSVSKQRPQKE
ncbi:hypothetical protein [Neptuniibacter halophilus]|uniref:hypothetical protein n=1 Tax=Neptuniibacter halophilus TaxID=651666 RepID=UPI0025733E4E|nr:hypothetical protein [Neptuniibacter halophilus]